MGAGSYKRILVPEEGKDSELRAFRPSLVGTPRPTLPLRTNRDLLMSLSSLGRTDSKNAEIAPPRTTPQGTPIFRENLPYSQQLQGRQMRKHSVLDLRECPIYQAPAGKRETKQGLGGLRSLGGIGSQPYPPPVLRTLCSGVSLKTAGPGLPG